MKCAWESFIQLLPIWMRNKVDKLGKKSMQELRLRINAPPELVFSNESLYLERCVTQEDIQLCINLATRYSPWAAETIAEGFIAIPGGHRIGLCGSAMPGKQAQKGFAAITSICIRISRDFQGIAKDAAVDGSILIIGSPGSGKTTFLRDLVRHIAVKDKNRIAVVDERYEIFPYAGNSFCFDTGTRIDVLSGYNKATGIEMVLRSMTPTLIAVDEITAQADAEAMLHSTACGVYLIATAHASSVEELENRPIYHLLLQRMVFQTFIVLQRDKNWRLERVKYDN